MIKKIFSGTIGTIILVVIAAAVGYFGNVELQSYWGRQALANTGLTVYKLDEAVAKAKAEDKLVLVDVSAIWCGTCRKLDNEIFSNEKIKRLLNERYVFSRIEYESEEGQNFAVKRGIKGFPNLRVLDGDGNDLKQLSVTFDPDEFASQL